VVVIVSLANSAINYAHTWFLSVEIVLFEVRCVLTAAIVSAIKFIMTASMKMLLYTK
jgi:hypothetical protein